MSAQTDVSLCKHAEPLVFDASQVRFLIIDTGVVVTLNELIEANPHECDDLHAWARTAVPGDEWPEGAGVRCVIFRDCAPE
jgi:hypothetical protein